VTEEQTDFLYPFIDGGEEGPERLLADLAASAEAKAQVSRHLTLATLERDDDDLDRVAKAMAERFAAGGRLFTFGNGGSATDAATVASLFTRPPAGPPLPARSLVADQAVLTALSNDVGFDLVFSRQLIAAARPDDIALGLSTSGNSDNVIRAFAEARRRRLLTVGVAGYDGGQMAASGDIDGCFVVRSHSTHRIQEAQAALCFSLWQRVRAHLDGGHRP
jgi:D-sedoheptulose 7-phosphate isomerase